MLSKLTPVPGARVVVDVEEEVELVELLELVELVELEDDVLEVEDEVLEVEDDVLVEVVVSTKGFTAIVIAYQSPLPQSVQEAGASVPLQFNL
jgi:hypothetical protein